MKIQTINPLLAATLVCFSYAAHAQSSVTLFGVIDVGINYINNARTGRSNGALTGHSQYTMQDGGAGGISGSRWGLRGVEDLGGGLSAAFQLENGFSINSGTLGQGGAEFGRQAWMGLKSTQYGMLTLGRQYDSLVNFVQPYTSGAVWAGYMGFHPGDVDNLGNTRRINNTVRYTSPTIAGFTLGGTYSLGGVTGSVSERAVYSIGGSFARGPVSLGAAYLNARNPNYSFYGTNPSAGTALTSNNLGSAGSATSAQSYPTYAGYASARTLQIIAAGGSYTLGAVTFGVNYSNTQFKHLGDTADSGPDPYGYTGTATFNSAEANVSYRFTPSLLGGVAYDYTHVSGSDGRSGALYHQASAGLDYFFTKRTDVYGIVVYQRASGTDSLNQPAVAAIAGQTPSSNNHQVAVRLGLRHKF
ncbi:porin [Paraburkholderia sediminicola]|uniref:porin n=1 Tax=Paraburkholderia sediminicola TaxID=458836 RepID=UPI0038BCA677